MVRQPNGSRRDDGSVLPLVLVLMVVAGLIVIPLLGYTMSVFRSNRVVSDRTGAVEAAKGGVRMAVGDPRNVFLTCDGGGDLTSPDPYINKLAVAVSCSEIDEVGPLEALGYEVPIGAVAMQLGETVPAEFSGDRRQSTPVPPYPASSDWWLGQQSSTATDGTIWMPNLPILPGTLRTNIPFIMPVATYGDCKVFFPGRYDQALTVTGNVYFASGVYYFEKPVTVAGNANVVVGFGLEELPNPDCSDDIQVAANVEGDPGTFGISGGGATWVFGRDGRLIVDDSTTTTTLGLRFNQRYDDPELGGRISIMTVNGNDILVPVADHVVSNVNRVPRSLLSDGTTLPVPTATAYAPSTSASALIPAGLTDKARVPQAPTGFTATALRYTDVTQRGAILLTWNEVTGQTAGGAFVDGYNITVNGTPVALTSCQPADLVVTALPVPPGGNQVSCLVKNLTLGTTYSVGVAARNWVGVGAYATATNLTPRSSFPASPVITVPAAPTNVAAVDSNVDDVAQVSWDAPANGGAPITRYVATAHRIYLQPQPNQPPVADNMTVYMSKAKTLVTGVAAFDPNGDALSLTVNTSGYPASVGTVTVAGRDITITTLAGASSGTYTFSYTVTDPSGLAVTRNISVVVTTSLPTNRAPVARSLALAANVGVPITSRIPVYDPNGHGFTSFSLNTAGFAAPEWNFTVTGLDVAITTTAPNGVYTIPYTVGDSTGQTANSTIVVTVARGDEVLASCQVTSSPSVPLANACEIPLPDLVPGDATSGNVGYRFDVNAFNAIGSSVAGSNLPPLPLAFNGAGVALPVPPQPPQTFEPWKPVPVIEIVTDNGGLEHQGVDRRLRRGADGSHPHHQPRQR